MKCLFAAFAALSLMSLACVTLPSVYENNHMACEREANRRDLAGGERRAFMDACMHNAPRPDFHNASDITPRLEACEHQANRHNLIGPERDDFLTECLEHAR